MSSLLMSQLPPVLDTASFGGLRFEITSSVNNYPIEGASIEISETGGSLVAIEQLTTDSNGRSSTIELSSPSVEYSLEPSAVQPYSEYTFTIRADGYEPVIINGAEILSTVTALQKTKLLPAADGEQNTAELFDIPPHTLYGDYPPPIPESEIKPVNNNGEIVLDSVVIPEYIVVHDGPPASSARDYYVNYRDYIKNVASSEIYATWPEATLYANILAIQSFTLNRVYTEWYRNKGYTFTITSSTAYDHKWIYGRNIYDTIDFAVDQIFSNYLSRPSVRQPILTQYCDGKKVTCPKVMSQWGSKSLGDEGYSAIEILRNYYGGSIYINTSEIVSGVPSSWPGYTLTQGSSGAPVQTVQEQINGVAAAYPAIPLLSVDGIYGQKTAASVKKFQSVFGLTQSGDVDFATWYKLSQIYVAVSRIAEYS